MSTAETISFAVELAGPDSPNQAEVAAAAFLARYSGRTLEAYRYDLRSFPKPCRWMPPTSCCGRSIYCDADWE